MALFILTLSVSPSWSAERSHARLAFPSFQRGFLFELTPLGKLLTTRNEFRRDRSLNAFMQDNHSREDPPYHRGLIIVYENAVREVFINTIRYYIRREWVYKIILIMRKKRLKLISKCPFQKSCSTNVKHLANKLKPDKIISTGKKIINLWRLALD